MKHIPSLDGLRGWAVLFVLLLHSNPIFHGFLFGVPFFFIISGFLITTILLESKYSFKMFIFRRLGRLLPASVVLISLTLMIYPLIPNGFDMPTLFGSIYALLFIVNYAQIFDLPHGWSGYFQHFWTLSLEIQFYMIIFFVLSVIDRREQKIIIFLVLSIILFFAYKMFNIPLVYRFNAIENNIFVFLVGSYASICRLAESKKTSLADVRILNYIMLFIIFMQFFIIGNIPKIFLEFLLPIFCLLAFYLLICIKNNLNNNSILLSHSCIKYVGQISYSLYLYHFPIYHLVDHYYADINPFFVFFVKLFITFLFALFSFYFVEHPLRKKFNNLFKA